MTDMRPVRVYSLKVPPGGEIVDSNPGVPASIRITMASIDPDEETEGPPRATLRLLHNVLDFFDEDDDDEDDDDDDDIEALEKRLGITGGDSDEDMEEDEDDEDEDEDEDDEELVNGGPSDPEKHRKAQEKALLKKLQESLEDDDSDDDEENGINGINKGKARAFNDDEDLDGEGIEEYIVCTLDRNMAYQVPLDITIRENEECYFRNSGHQTIHLTGNFVITPEEMDDDDDEDDSEDEDDGLFDLANLDALEDYDDEEDDEEDELDGLADPRVMELDGEDEDEEVPQLVKASSKNKNKRSATDDDETPDGILKKIANGEKPSKKLKANSGQAVANSTTEGSKKSKKEEVDTPTSNGKKVSFAEKLEQGPTPSKNAPAASSATPKGPRTVSGVTVDDKKQGTGPGAKKGDRVGMRYIGKLKDGKVFDSNKKGKPFTFKLGTNEVIKGWDIGVQGMAVGGERRIIVPPKLAYGSKALPGIPANSELTFDLKLISIN